MARDIFGNRKITKEDMYTRKKAFTASDFRWAYFKMFLILLSGYAYLHFIVMGWTW